MTTKTFVPRRTAPKKDDKNWINYRKGGTNYCVIIDDETGSVLPNCTGYAWGRWSELLGSVPGKLAHNLSRGNAEVWWGKQDGYKRSQTPVLGAIACYKQGSAGTGSDGAGHVAVVEEIRADGTIVISNSAYKGSNFYMREMKPPYNYKDKFTLQGFIHPPVNFVMDDTTNKDLLPLEDIAKEVRLGRWGNGQDRVNRLTKAGYNAKEVQAEVDRQMKKENSNTKPPKKSNEEIAKEVRLGRWGNGQDRVNRLTKAGYDAKAIQDIVNRQNGSRATNEEVANQVILGKYGNGEARRKKLIKEGYDPDVIQSIVNRKLR